MTQRIVLTTLLLMALLGRPQAQIDLHPDSTTLGSPVNITNTFYNNGMQFPAADGHPGQVLTTNGSGQLSWQNAPVGEDLSSLYESLCNSPNIFQLGTNTSSNDICGILYDSGGPNGNYGLNESFTFSLQPSVSVASPTLTRVILRTLDIEENQDTLFIEGTPYFSTLSSPDTLYFSDGNSVQVRFVSNSSNPGDPYQGFELYWEAIQFSGSESSSFIPGDFVFVPDQQSAHGGFHESVDLQNLGKQSLLLGYWGEASGSESSSVGHRNGATGDRSSAFGYSNAATGSSSSALGYVNEATEFRSSAFGTFNDASGVRSSAFGYENDATGERSSAFGYENEATGDGSSAFGYENEATGVFSSAFGDSNAATGDGSSAFGTFNDATGDRSSAFGYGNEANLYQMTAIGTYNQTVNGSSNTWIPTEPVFMVGNGENSFNPSTALTILKNGNTGIGTNSPEVKLEVNGRLRIGSYEELSDGGGSSLACNSNFIPEISGWSLGSSSFRWGAVYANNGTIITSDRREKENIRSLEYGLKEVLQLKPVRFAWKNQPIHQEKLGLIAQDLQKVIPEVVQDHEWVRKENAPDAPPQKVPAQRLGVYYSDIIPVLIKAIQEQQLILDEKERANELLRQEVQDLEYRLSKIEALLSGQSEEDTSVILNGNRASLEQNIPNPFRGVTRIDYFLPEGTQRATLLVNDMQGRELQRIPLQNTGRGQIDLQTRNLTAGTYSYSLYVDGALIETRQMVVEQ